LSYSTGRFEINAPSGLSVESGGSPTNYL